MTNIDDSTQTPPGYWFGVIESRLHERMREALAELGLRRGGWRILHSLADGPATADELADRMPHGRDNARRGGHGRPDAFGRPDTFGRMRTHGAHPGWRGQEPRDERDMADPQQQHEHERGEAGHGQEHQHGGRDHHPDTPEQDHHHGGHGFERAFERGYLRGFDRGFTLGATRGGHPFGPYGHGAFPGRDGYGPFPGAHGHGPFPAGDGHGPFPDARGQGPWATGRGEHPFARRGDPRARRRGHRIQRVLADFVERGWVWFDGDRATLTEEGLAAHDRAFERVQAVRAELADSIPESDYATTVATLERMARNLGWRPADGPAPAGDVPSMDA